MRQIFISIAMLLAAMSSIQVGATMAKKLFVVIGPAPATLFRVWISAVMLGVGVRPWRGRLSREAALAVLRWGLALGGMNLLFYLALSRIPLGITVAIEFSGPLFVSLVASRRPLDYVWAALAAAGILLLLPLRGTGAVDPLGAACALGAGACWGLYIVFGKRAGALLPATRATALGMCVAALFVTPTGLATLKPELITREVWLAALCVGLLSGAVPYLLEMAALKRLPAKTFGILMSVEPALAAFIGLVLLGERLTSPQWIAIACVIAAAAGSTLTASSARRRDKAKP